MTIGSVLSQVGQLIGLVEKGHNRNDRFHRDRRVFENAVVDTLTKLERKIDRMSQQLMDAVGALAGNVQTLATSVGEHDATMQSLIAALQAALAANPGTSEDPDIARAIDAISQASSSVAQSADTINTETQKMAAAVLPPPAPTPVPTPDAG